MKIFPSRVDRKCPHGPVCNRSTRHQGLLVLFWAASTFVSAWRQEPGWAIFSAWCFGITFDSWLSHVREAW